MACNTGAPVSELTGLRVRDVLLERQLTLLLHGKGGNKRVIPLWASTAADLRAWLHDPLRSLWLSYPPPPQCDPGPDFVHPLTGSRCHAPCQGTVGTARWRPRVVPANGHQICPVAAIRHARVALLQWLHPGSGEGLGQADAIAGGLAEVGVMEQPVDGGGGQGLGHQLVEPGRVQI